MAPYGGIAIQFRRVSAAWLESMPYPVMIWTPDVADHWRFADRVFAVITNEPRDFMTWRPTTCGG